MQGKLPSFSASAKVRCCLGNYSRSTVRTVWTRGMQGWEKVCVFPVSSALTPLGWSHGKLLIKRPVTVWCELICDIRRYMNFSAQPITKWFPRISVYRNGLRPGDVAGGA